MNTFIYFTLLVSKLMTKLFSQNATKFLKISDHIIADDAASCIEQVLAHVQCKNVTDTQDTTGTRMPNWPLGFLTQLQNASIATWFCILIQILTLPLRMKEENQRMYFEQILNVW